MSSNKYGKKFTSGVNFINPIFSTDCQKINPDWLAKRVAVD